MSGALMHTGAEVIWRRVPCKVRLVSRLRRMLPPSQWIVEVLEGQHAGEHVIADDPELAFPDTEPGQ